MTPRKELDIFLLNILFVNILSKQNVSRMSKDEVLNVINNLDVSDNIKEYFSLITNGVYNDYATTLLKTEIIKRRLR